MLVVVTYLYSLTFYDYSNFVSCWHTSRALIITFDLPLPFPSYSPKSFVYPFQKVVASFWDKAKVHLAWSFFSSICMLVFGNTQIKIPVREIGLNTTIFYHLYPTFPKGIILLQQLLGRSRQRENSFVVLLLTLFHCGKNPLTSFFFFGKLSFSWLVLASYSCCCKTHFLKGKEQMVTLFCLFTTIACMKDVSSDGKICISCQMNQC